jgi:hypothetical protein
MSDTPQLPPGWRASTAPDGRQFYYNRATKETRWDPPQIDRAAVARRAQAAGVFGSAPRRAVPTPQLPGSSATSPRVIACLTTVVVVCIIIIIIIIVVVEFI